MTPLLPLYRDALHYSPVEAALLLVSYVLGLAPALLSGSALSAAIGTRRVLGFGLLLGAAGSVVLALGSDQPAVLLAGRVLSGLGVGAAMTAGVDLVRLLRLGRVPGDESGAVLRGSMTLTAGLGAGAAVSGCLATWAPAPTVLPYVAHLLGTLIAGAVLTGARVAGGDGAARPGFDLPRTGSRTGHALVLIAAPWVFGAAAIAYAGVPATASLVPVQLRVAYAAMLTLATLAVGTAVQPLGARLARRSGLLGMAAGLAIMVPGLVVAARVAVDHDPVTGMIAAGILGAGFGVALIAGLSRTRALVAAGGGAGLVGGYYAATYAGFGLPALIAATASREAPAVPLLVVSGATAATAVALVVFVRLRPSSSPEP